MTASKQNLAKRKKIDSGPLSRRRHLNATNPRRHHRQQHPIRSSAFVSIPYNPTESSLTDAQKLALFEQYQLDVEKLTAANEKLAEEKGELEKGSRLAASELY